MNAMFKFMTVIGAGTLAVLAVWGFVIIAAPSVSLRPPADKVASTPPLRDPKLRDVTAQPHTTAVPVISRIAPVVPPAPPAPVIATAQPKPDPSPVAAAPVTPPSPTATAEAENPQEPAATQVAADPANDPVGVIEPAPEPTGRQAHAAHCTRYRTYNAATQSYRGFDGVVHPCRP